MDSLSKKITTKKKSLLGFLFSNVTALVMALFISWICVYVIHRYFHYATIVMVVALLVINVLSITKTINSKLNSSIKLMYVTIIALTPFLGVLYAFLNINELRNDKNNKRLQAHLNASNKHMPIDEEVLKTLKNNKELEKNYNFFKSTGNIAIYNNSKTIYFDKAELMFEDMLKEMQKANYFIYLDLGILNSSKALGKLLSVLDEKRRKGVDIKLVYDETSNLTSLPKDFSKKLNDLGIITVCYKQFNFLPKALQAKDHRSCIVVDGLYGYVFSHYISDETMNLIHPFGYYKSNGVKIIGEAVKSLTLQFLEIFSYRKKELEYSDLYVLPEEVGSVKGWMIPFVSDPIEGSSVLKQTTLNMLSDAKQYFCLLTDSLNLDQELENALILAARKGIEVIVVLSNKNNWKLTTTINHSFYQLFYKENIKIYQYSLGSLGSNILLSDNYKAVISSDSFNFSGFQNNHVNGFYLYKDEAIADIREDVKRIINNSHKINRDDLAHMRNSKLLKLFQNFLPLI